MPAAAFTTFAENVQEAPTARVAPVRDTVPEPAVAVIVPPPHVPVRAFGVAITIPAGNVSVNATPVSATVFAAGLVTVKLNDVGTLIETVPAPNALLIVGGATTVMLAVAVEPVPPSTELTVLVVLFFVPAVVPVTLTVKLQEPPPAAVPPVSVTVAEPAVAVMTPAPHEPVSPFGVETTRPAGSESVTPTPVSAVAALGLLIVKLSDVDPFSGILPAPNAFAIVGGATTVIDALEVSPAPLSIAVTVTELFFWPAVVPVTFTDTVQAAFPASDPTARLTEPEPAVAVVVPPQLLFTPFGVATTRPAGKLSVNANPVSVRPVFGFWILNVRLVVPFSGICAAPNAFAILGGIATDKLAVAVFPVPPFVEVTFPVVFVN